MVYQLVFGGVRIILCKSDIRNHPLKLLVEETLKSPYSKLPDLLIVVIITFVGILIFVFEDKFGLAYKNASLLAAI
jgi:hypothetical protein